MSAIPASEPPVEATIQVAIVEDDRQTRDGLCFLIDGAPGFRCVGAFASAEEALEAPLEPAPDVVLLDVHLTGVMGSRAVPSFRARWPATEILMLTAYAEQDVVFESICNGASGYLLKTTPPARLLDAMRELRTGGAPMSPEIARRVVELFRRTSPPEPASTALTLQERRLLTLLARGYRYQAAADELHVSVNTIRNYIRSVYDKLHVHSKSEAVSKALRQGLIQ